MGRFVNKQVSNEYGRRPGIPFALLFSFALLSAGVGGSVCFSQTLPHGVTGGRGDRAGGYAFVDPFIGTTKSSAVTRWGSEGGVYPGAVAPWGFVQLSPETRVGDARGYDYSDSVVYYFSCFHHASGFPGGSSGAGFVMPLTANLSVGSGGMAGVDDAGGNRQIAGTARVIDSFRLGHYHRPFLHSGERAEPGYYRLRFSDDGTEVETAASERTGAFRFHYPMGVTPRIFIGGMGKLSGKNNRVFEGSGMVYTSMQFSEEVTGRREVDGGILLEFAPRRGDRGVAGFIELSMGVSTVSIESAENNITAENAGGVGSGGDFFDRIRTTTREKWAKLLSAVEIGDTRAPGGVQRIQGGKQRIQDGDRREIFYTALYHSLLLPWIVSDADGDYRGADRQVHRVKGRREFGEFSPWDTFRSLHPLLCLLYPGVQREMIGSMLDVYRERGRLPTETMTGDHSIPILVDSWFKGIRDDDSLLVYAAMRKGVVDTPFSKTDRKVYLEEGYVPSDHPESVTRTVEYAYDDWVLSRFASAVMHSQKDSVLLAARGRYYRNLFDPEELFMLPRRPEMTEKAAIAGGKDEPVAVDAEEDPGAGFTREPGTTGYKEGDKWVYSYFVPQDGRGLVNLMGGAPVFTARLDSALAGGQILFDNETIFHIPYLFNDAGRPDKTQEWVTTIMDTRYSATPGGLPGNDDLGSMSAWYVLSAMGIFPACPGRPYYAIGAPVFERLSFRVAGGKNWVISRVDEGREQSIPTGLPAAGAGAGPGGGVGAEPGSGVGGRGGGRSIFISSLEVNHRPYGRLWIPHSLLMAGGEMVFRMGLSPAESWVDRGAKPYPDETQQEMSVTVSDLSVSETRLRPNEDFWVRFRLFNRGATGTKIVRLYANGVETGQKNILVKGGAVRIDSMQSRLYGVGRIGLHIDGLKDVGVTVVVPGGSEPANEVLGVSGVAVKALMKVGDPQTIHFSARNIGGYRHVFYIPVRVDDSLVATDSLSLAPGEEKELSHEIDIREAKEYAVRVQTFKTHFRAYDRDTGSVLLNIAMDKWIGDSLVADGSGLSNNGVIMRSGAASGRQFGKKMDGKGDTAMRKEKNEAAGKNETSGVGGKNATGEKNEKSGSNEKERGDEKDPADETKGLLRLGRDCYIEIPNSPSLDHMGTTITMMAWIYPEERGRGLVDVFSKGDNHVLQVSGGRELTFFAGGWGRGDCTVSLPADWLRHWHHIAGVCDGKKLYLYIDGVLKGESVIEAGVNLSVASRWTIGRNAEFPGERIFEGYMDQVKVFAEPLSKEEVAGIYQEGMNRFE